MIRSLPFFACMLLHLPLSLMSQPTPTTLTNPVLQDHVDRLLAMLNGVEAVYNATEYSEQFSPEFVQQVPLEDGFTPIVEDLRASSSDWKIVSIVRDQILSAVILIAPQDTGQPLLELRIGINENDQINQLLLQDGNPPTLENEPETLQEAVDQIKAMGHNFQYVVADASQCEALAGENIHEPAPMGSMFKLWVLGAVVDAVQDERIQWDELVTITEEAKSLPSGILQDLPPGTNRTVQELATLMISISDNTATDLLIRLVGRSAVEQALVDYGHNSSALNMPFLTTKEFFILKLEGAQGDGQPGPLGEQYINADEQERRSILAGLEGTIISSMNLSLAAWAGGPIAVEELEWFGSPMDLCRVLGGLYENEQAASILAINPGVPDQAEMWSYIGYKGGGEPGMLGNSWYVVPSNATNVGVGHRVVTATVWDTSSVIDVTTAALLFGALRDLSLIEDLGGAGASSDAMTSAPSAGLSETESNSDGGPTSAGVARMKDLFWVSALALAVHIKFL